MAKLTKAELAADKTMRLIWAEWFAFYQAHFRGCDIAISAADQMAFYEIAQPKLFDLMNKVRTPIPVAVSRITEDQIKHMVDRFLGWMLPESFNPDGGIIFKRRHQGFFDDDDNIRPARDHWAAMPTGTNLFDARQADAMVRYMIAELPLPVSREEVARADVQEIHRQAASLFLCWPTNAIDLAKNDSDLPEFIAKLAQFIANWEAKGAALATAILSLPHQLHDRAAGVGK